MTDSEPWPSLDEFKTITLDKIHLGWSRAISEMLIGTTLSINRDYVLRQFVYTIEGYIWGEKLNPPQTIRYPSDWWQAFKERWCPAWALRRWPVLYTVHSITASALYPDFKRAMPDERCVMDIHVFKEPN